MLHRKHFRHFDKVIVFVFFLSMFVTITLKFLMCFSVTRFYHSELNFVTPHNLVTLTLHATYKNATKSPELFSSESLFSRIPSKNLITEIYAHRCSYLDA